MNEWTLCLDQRKPVDVLCLNFQKAFDKVPHRRLISKLHAYGIDGNLLYTEKLSSGKTFAVFTVFHSIANAFPRIMALLIGNVSLQA